MIKIESKGFKIKQVLTEALSSSTSHGIPNIIKSQKKSIKLIWSIFLLISTGLFAYMMVQSVLSYLKFEVTTKIRILDEFRPKFPAITICNLNHFTTPFSLEYIRNISNQLNLNIFDDTKNITMTDIDTVYDYAFNEATKLPLNISKKFSYSIDEALLDCFYEQEKCTSKDFNSYFHELYGNCFQFNSGFNQSELRTSWRSGKYLGLMLELFVGVPDKLKFLTRTFGLMVFIQNQTDSPTSVEGIYIMPGEETNIGITRTFHSQIPKPYSNCDLDEKTKASFHSELFDLVSKNQDYRKNNCFNLCYQKYLYHKCNCRTVYITSYVNNTLPCVSDEESQCEIDFIGEVSDGSFLSEYCLPQCPTECEKNHIDYRISSCEYSSDERDAVMKKQTEVKKVFSSELFNSSLRSNALLLNIYYETLTYTRIEETESMDFVSLLSNIGGIAGLFLGISVLSFVEIIEIFCQIAFIYFKF